MAGENLLFAAALVVLAACSENLNSLDPMPPAPPLPVGGNPISSAAFWVNPQSSAKPQADAWRVTRPADAAQMDKIARNSRALWMDGA